MSGILYIVPTPVGNLEDMTFRAIRVLKEADLILAEDTRTSSVLLKHFEIKGRLESHHKFNEHKTASMIKERILSGLDVALISDAGTPGISDPGFLLVRTCAQEGIEIQTLPGATAFVPEQCERKLYQLLLFCHPLLFWGSLHNNYLFFFLHPPLKYSLQCFQ